MSVVSTSTPNIRLHVTRNAYDKNGPSWIDRSAGLPSRVITQIRADPIDPATAYVTFSGFAIGPDLLGHVLRPPAPAQAGATVSGNLPNLPVNDIAIDPDLPETLYIGTDAGVMVTADGGTTWSTLGSGLPKVVVYSLVLHRASRILRAATHGRSVWDIAVPLPSASIQPAISSISPSLVNAGGPAFVLSVNGSNFTSGTIVRWNGQDRTTQYVDPHRLTAQIGAADIAGVGRAAILAFSPSTGAGVSNPVALTIRTGSGHRLECHRERGQSLGRQRGGAA